MTKPVRYTLGKTERLKSRKLIEQLFNEGKALTVFPFRIIYRVQSNNSGIPNSELQAGFSASAKNFKRAVDRNRIKRLTKEAYRLQKNALQELLQKSNQQAFVFFIYTGKEIPDYALVTEKITAALKKLTEQIGKASA